MEVVGIVLHVTGRKELEHRTLQRQCRSRVTISGPYAQATVRQVGLEDPTELSVHPAIGIRSCVEFVLGLVADLEGHYPCLRPAGLASRYPP